MASVVFHTFCQVIGAILSALAYDKFIVLIYQHFSN